MTISPEFQSELIAAIRSGNPLPAYPEGLTLEGAYSALKPFTLEACDNSIAGIKAGITNPEVQQLFGLESALLGYLYDWGQLQAGASMVCREGGQIECELGIVLDDEGRPVSVAPAIEFVKVAFSNPTDFTPGNLVLANLGADQFMFGAPHDWDEESIDELADVTIRLTHDGNEVLETTSTASLGGARGAVTWCVEEASRRQLLLGQQTLLMAGTCGAAIPQAPGHYVADYGPLGKIEFDLVAGDS